MSSYPLDAKNINTLRNIIQDLKKISMDPSLGGDREKKNDLETEIRILETAISSSRPSITIIKETMSSVKGILETTDSVAAIARPLITRIASWLNGLG